MLAVYDRYYGEIGQVYCFKAFDLPSLHSYTMNYKRGQTAVSLDRKQMMHSRKTEDLNRFARDLWHYKINVFLID